MKNLTKYFYIWVSGYFVCVLFLLICYFKGWSFEENLRVQFADLTAIFAPYLTAMLGFWFPKKIAQENQKKASAQTGLGHVEQAFKVATICALFFNGIMVLLLSRVFFGEDAQIEATITTMRYFSIILAFLVGPSIVFLFKSEK